METEQRRGQLCGLLSSTQPEAELTVDALVDSLLALYYDCKASNPAKSTTLFAFVQKYESLIKKLKAVRWSLDDFETVKMLANGAFGTVFLVKQRSTGSHFAMKQLKKAEMLRQQDTAFFMEERLVMTLARTSRWLVSVVCAFQDEENLNLVMEFIPGGDLMSLLCKQESAVFTEEQARFYAAEIILALEDLHSMNYVHRDLKPDNLLIDARGHIKLTDFGSCVKVDNDSMVSSKVAVGTPDYISPEVLRAQEGSGKYGKECDWWSFGILLYEMLTGEPPFYAETLVETYGKIMNHKKSLKIPASLSKHAKDILGRLICDREERLGLHGTLEIKNHPFFNGIDWARIHEAEAPCIPDLQSPEDVSNFEDEVDENSTTGTGKLAPTKVFAGYHLPFIGYSFHEQSISAVPSGASLIHTDDTRVKALQSKIEAEEVNCKRLSDLNEKLRKHLEASKDEISLLEKKSFEYEKEKIALEMSKNDLERRIEFLVTEKTALERKVEREEESRSILNLDKFQKDVDLLAANLAEAQKQITLKEAEIVSLQSIKAQKEKLADDLEDKLRASEQEKTKIIEEAESTKQILDKCELDLKELQKHFDGAKKEIEKLLAEIEAKQKEKKEEAEKRIASEEKCRALEALKSQLDFELAQKSKQLKDSIEESKETSRRLLQVEQQISAQSNHAEFLLMKEKEVSDLKLKIESLNQNQLATEDQLNSLQKALATSKIDLESSLNKLKEEGAKRAALEQQYNEARAALSDSEAKERHYRDLLSKTEKEKERLTESIGHQKNLSEKAQADKDLLIARAQKLEKSNSELHIKVTQLNEKLSKASTETEDGRSRADLLKSKLVEEEKRSSELERGFSEKLLDIGIKESEVSRLLKELDMAKEQISLLQAKTRLVELEAKENARLATKEAKEKQSLESETAELRKAKQDLEVLFDSVKSEIGSTRTTLHEKEALLAQIKVSLDQAVEEKKIIMLQNEKLKQKAEFDQVKLQELVKKMEGTLITEKSEKRRTFFFGSSNSDESELKKTLKVKLRDMKALEQRLNSEITAKRALEEELNEVKSAKAGIEAEFEALKKASNQSVGAKRPLTGELPLLDSMQIHLEGWLKVPSEKGLRNAWKKVYVTVKDFKIYLSDKEKEINLDCEIANIKAELFDVRAAQGKELMHVPAKDVPNIFLISSQSMITKKSAVLNESDLDGLTGKIKSIEKELQVEEKVHAGIDKVHKISSGAAKANAEKQLDGSEKKMQFLRKELDRLKTLECSSLRASTCSIGSEIDAERQMAIQELESEIQKEEASKEALEKALQSTKKPAELQKELQMIARRIASHKAEIEAVKSPDWVRKGIDFNGHSFRVKSFKEATLCQHCNELLWGSANQGLSCTGCKMVCHKSCYTLLTVSCTDNISLKDAQSFYFMASNQNEKNKWINGLKVFRKLAVNE